MLLQVFFGVLGAFWVISALMTIGIHSVNWKESTKEHGGTLTAMAILVLGPFGLGLALHDLKDR